MRESHLEQIERWARFVKNNPAKWKRDHTAFINSLFAKNEEVLQRLQATPEGKEKIKKLYGGRF